MPDHLINVSIVYFANVIVIFHAFIFYYFYARSTPVESKMKSRTLAICLVLCFHVCENKKSLEHFIRKKVIDKSRITILNTANEEINYTWIEYHYSFDDTKLYLTHDLPNETNIAVNVYFKPTECENARGKAYSSYIQNLLDVLTENDELFFGYLNQTEETADLYACTHASTTGSHGFNGFHPLHAILSSRYALIYSFQNKAKDIFVLTFVGTLWLVFLVVLLLLAVCLRISTHYYSRIYNGRRWSWVEITLWAIAAACQQGKNISPAIHNE